MDRNKEVEKEATKYAAASNSPPKNTPTTSTASAPSPKPSAPPKPRIPQPDPEEVTTPKIEDNNR